MFFGELTKKLQKIFQKLYGQGKLTEVDVNKVMREVRLILLEADVNVNVVKDFIIKVKERSIGQKLMESITPGNFIIKIVHEELTNLLGGTQSKLYVSPSPPTVIMVVGLQGSGKTTTSCKIANWLKKQGKKPLLVAADVYRPAAIRQLKIIGNKLEICVFSVEDNLDPVYITARSMEYAILNMYDTIIIDTTGQLQTNKEHMLKLKNIKYSINVHETLLVVDAMTGQDAINIAKVFNTELIINGIVLTKLDGDARGGAAISMKVSTGCPIKFIGIGEHFSALEPFYPERIASRILNMGDILGLIEKATENININEAKKIEKKLQMQEFTLNDFLGYLQQVRKIGPLEQILSMLPNIGEVKNKLKNTKIYEKEFKQFESIIYSMTYLERNNPEIINGSRRKRIALGSGTKVQEVNRLLRQFSDTKKIMKKFYNMKNNGKGLNLPFIY